jgi:hypothetical protein
MISDNSNQMIRHTLSSPEGQGHLEHGRRHSEPAEILYVCALPHSESQLRRGIPTFRVLPPVRATGRRGRYETAGGYLSRHRL